MPLAIPTRLFFLFNLLWYRRLNGSFSFILFLIIEMKTDNNKKKRSIEFYNRTLCLGESQHTNTHTRKKKKYIIIEFLILLAVNIAAYSIWYGFLSRRWGAHKKKWSTNFKDCIAIVTRHVDQLIWIFVKIGFRFHHNRNISS